MLQETPNTEANIPGGCSRRVEVCLDDVSPTHIYTIVTFTLTMPTGELRTRGSENRALSVQHVERFASGALKGGKIVAISILKAFLVLHIIFVGLIATAWLGGPTVARASYVRYYCVLADIPEWFSTFRNLPQLVHSLRSCNFWSFVLLYIAHVIPDQRHRSSYLLLRSDVCLMLSTPVLQLKVLFLYIVGQNKCACKVRKKSTLLLCSTVWTWFLYWKKACSWSRIFLA